MKKIILIMFLCLSAVSKAENNNEGSEFNSLVAIYTSQSPASTVAVVTQAGHKAELFTCTQFIMDPTKNESETLGFFRKFCSLVRKNDKFYGYKKTILKNRLGEKVNLVISGSGVVYMPLEGELFTDTFTYSINIRASGAIIATDTVELVGSRIINTELDVPVISTYRVSLRQMGNARARLNEID